MSIAPISCSASAAMCSGLARMARMAPVILGCIVLTRPSSISGNPVTSATSRTVRPASRKALAVPPVEISSTPRALNSLANSAIPVLSVTLIRARLTWGIETKLTRRPDGDSKQLAWVVGALDGIGAGSPHPLEESLEFGHQCAIRVVMIGRKQPVVDGEFAIGRIELQLAGEGGFLFQEAACGDGSVE